MQLTTYLSFKGDCEAAFEFYELSLGGVPGPIFRYGVSPMADRAPADWSDKVMHGSITVGGQVLMGADIAPDQYEEPKGLPYAMLCHAAANAAHFALMRTVF
jgi:PhnB protein